MTRCYNPKHGSYYLYGGSGVTVCDRWKGNFENFLEDIDKIEGWDLDKYLYSKIQLDKDFKQQGVKNKVYSKDTCIFVTSKQNNSFKDSTVKFYVYTPEGNIEQYENIREYCMDKGINRSHAGAMIRGDKTRKSIKGYQFFNHYPREDEIHKRKTYKAISPKGEEIIFYKYKDIEKYGLTEHQVRQSIRTEKPTTNGWKVYKVQDGYTLL